MSLSGSKRSASDTMKSKAAMASCAQRKNKGVVVVLRTHLLLVCVREYLGSTSVKDIRHHHLKVKINTPLIKF